MRLTISTVFVTLFLASIAYSMTRVDVDNIKSMTPCQNIYSPWTSFSVNWSTGGHPNARTWLAFRAEEIPDNYASVILMLSNGNWSIPLQSDITIMMCGDPNFTHIDYELPRYDAYFWFYWGRHEVSVLSPGTSELDITEAIGVFQPLDQEYLVICFSMPVCSTSGASFYGHNHENPDLRPHLLFEQAIPAQSETLGGVKGLFR